MATLNKNLMKFRFLFQTFTLFLLLTACTSPTQPSEIVSTQTSEAISTPQPLTGTWMGTAHAPDGKVNSLIINFDESTLQVEPYSKTWEFFVSQIDSTFQFSVEGKERDPFQNIKFTGSFTNDMMTASYGQPNPDALVISATINLDGTTSQSFFIPIQTIAEETYTQYEGLYQFDSGKAFSIIVSPQFSAGGIEFFSKTLMMTDFENGDLRALYPVNDSTFLIGSLRVVGAPFVGRIEFIKDDLGNVTGLNWWQTPNDLLSSPVPGFFASRISFTQERITFTSADGTNLAGLLSIPNSAGPHAAMMMLHGSEAGAKDNFGNKVMAHYMLSQGIAILNYDKRGVGESEGRYQEAASQANLQRHADDAIAGVQYLLTRPEIDAKKIGLIGFSQAGWIIPLAASQSSDISFFVNLSGPVASFGQEDKFSAYTDDSYTAREYDDAIITQQLREMNPSGFDPLPIIAELNQKGLWLWGSVDKSVPITFSAENLQAIIDTGKDNFSYQIFPNGDHNLNLSTNGYFNEIPFSSGVLFYEFLKQWLETYILSL